MLDAGIGRCTGGYHSDITHRLQTGMKSKLDKPDSDDGKYDNNHNRQRQTQSPPAVF
jgi:hypothetical protein